MNPIEQAISKVKRKLRDAKERTVNGLHSSFSRLFTLFPPSECRSYFEHSGYRYS